MENLFVYGTLLFPEIVFKITGKSFKSKPARLKNYKRYLVKGCDYPAVIESKGDSVNGLLLENVDSRAMVMIAHFEGVEYEKRIVEVVTEGKKMRAVTFVWLGNIEQLNGDWDFVKFEQSALHNYF